jgi:hypothetical protein
MVLGEDAEEARLLVSTSRFMRPAMASIEVLVDTLRPRLASELSAADTARSPLAVLEVNTEPARLLAPAKAPDRPT